MSISLTDERGPHPATSITFSGGMADYITYLNHHVVDGPADLPFGSSENERKIGQVEHREPIHPEVVVLAAEDSEQHIKAEIALH